MPKNLLFITWDSDSSNYLESLFFPILSGLASEGTITPFVCQYSWAGSAEVERISSLAKQRGIHYFHQKVYRKPVPFLGSLRTVRRSKRQLLAFIQANRIEILMPRSTMPAWMVLGMVGSLPPGIELIFDADGLPIQERVDFSGLKQGGFLHRLLSGIEDRMLENADKVLVRSHRSADIHLQRLPHLKVSKFWKVGNGRSSHQFYFQDPQKETRVKLGVGEHELLLVHSGSLGGGYETDRMFGLLGLLLDRGVAAKLLLLTQATAQAQSLIPDALRDAIRVYSGSFESIPEILRASDIGICFRKKSKSIAGISPIKLGEYLMCGLPVMMSPGIGDFDEVLSGEPFIWMARDVSEAEGFLEWQEKVKVLDRNIVAEFGRAHFSLDRTLDSYRLALEL